MVLLCGDMEKSKESLYQTGNIEINLQGRRAHKEHINHSTQNESLPQPCLRPPVFFCALNISNRAERISLFTSSAQYSIFNYDFVHLLFLKNSFGEIKEPKLSL